MRRVNIFSLAYRLLYFMKIYVILDDYAGYDSRFYGGHGVSYLVEYDNIKVLFDTGPNPDVVLHNMKLLNIDPVEITHIVLSHSHYDHTGGLIGVLKAVGRKIPVIAHPELFKRVFAVDPVLREVGAPFTRAMLEDLAYLYLTHDPVKLSSRIYTTGEVRDRLEFEQKGLKVFMIKDGRLVEDPLLDDVSMCIDHDDGIVVVSGCSHAGIISITRRCMDVLDKREVRAVIGGFHLINASRDRISKTVDWFKKLKVREIYTGHCTGLEAEYMIKEAFGDRFHKLYSGMTIEI